MAILRLIIELYTYVIFAAVVISWVPDLRKYPVARWVDSVTEPVFAQVRKVIPPIGGLDLSSLVVLVGLGLLRNLFR
ncbi:MAG: YggT family protein [Myxococcales bacterium]